MTTNATIVARIEGATFVIELPDPAAGGLSRSALVELAVHLRRANSEQSVHVLMLLGGRTEFCLGVDLAEFADEGRLDDLADALRRCFSALDALEKPLIAVVEGPAIGFGASIVCHADVVVAAPHASFEAPFVPLGLLPEAGSTVLAPQRIGYLRAFRFLCLGDKMTVEEAAAAGLVTEVALDARSRGDAFAKRLAKLPRDAVLTARSLLRGNRKDVGRRIDLEIDACRQRLKDPELRRRIAVFAGAASVRRRAMQAKQTRASA